MSAVLAFGMGQAVPDNAISAWGARAIVNQDGLVDLVQDRQDFVGTDDVLAALNTRIPLSEVREIVSDLLRCGLMRTRVGETFVLYQDRDVVVVANTLGSHGYCYLAAWTTAPIQEDRNT